eukprot:13804061-Alexandrium_andersonii.AAC.1
MCCPCPHRCPGTPYTTQRWTQEVPPTSRLYSRAARSSSSPEIAIDRALGMGGWATCGIVEYGKGKVAARRLPGGCVAGGIGNGWVKGEW